MKRLTTFLFLIGSLVALGAFAVVSATASSTKAANVTQTMVIVGHSLGAKGSDGLRHDTTLGANFTVAQGSKVTVTVYNYDEGPHTITAGQLGLNVTIPGAKDEENGVASKTTFTFTATKAGKFLWFCSLPCDKGQGYWDMKSPSKKIGFMAGYITVTA
jgi:membrane fusion protein, multidrug efflux system